MKEERATVLFTPEEPFGMCSLCKTNSGVFFAGRNHFHVCHTHRILWYTGRNILSGWRYQSETEQQVLWEEVASYRDVTGECLPGEDGDARLEPG